MRPVVRAVSQTASAGVASSNKVVRNTYTLLSVTLLFSAFMAAVSMAIEPPRFTGMICSLAALGLIWLVLPRTANSASGLGVVFGITGLLGFGLGPLLNAYMGLPHGPQIVMQALGTTGVAFMALSGFVLVTKKDFSFMGGFLMTGLIVAIVSMLVIAVAAMFGYPMPAAALGLSALVALLMCGFILFDTSRIVNGGETNYIYATVALYLDIYNLFIVLLQLIGAFSSDE
jgi:modulator of FtsH protease